MEVILRTEFSFVNFVFLNYSLERKSVALYWNLRFIILEAFNFDSQIILHICVIKWTEKLLYFMTETYEEGMWMLKWFPSFSIGRPYM